MHDRFWTGRIAEHIAVGQNLCYTWSIIGKEGTYEENYLSYAAITDDQYTEAVVGRFSWK